MRHTIQALVENKFGVLARVASLFSARGYNIISLTVGETQDPTMSCMTVVVDAEDERILEQINKQLHKLIDVVTVIDFTRKAKESIDRELLLIKVRKRKDSKNVITKLVKKYAIKVLDESQSHYVLEICTEYHKAEEILKELGQLGIKELVRTGKVAISK